MNFLKASQNITTENINQIRECIEDRVFFLEMREPESEGSSYDEWEEKYEDMVDIEDKVNSIVNDMKNEKADLDDDLKELSEMISDYQIFHGGLSRLKIN